MITVDRSNFTETAPHRFATEASDLGWKAGAHIPRRLAIPGVGNGQPFVLDVRRSSRDKWVYAQDMGCVDVVIFND